MASVGPQNPTAASNGSGLGPSWVQPTNVFSSDNAPAHVDLEQTPSSQQTSKTLLVTGFDFSSIPSGATINGIVVEMERRETGGKPYTSLLQLTKNGTDGVGDDKADPAVNWPSQDAYVSYGDPNDLWGTAWTVAEIQASTFGVIIGASIAGKDRDGTAAIDHVRITVYYTPAGWGPLLAGQRNRLVRMA